MRSVGRDELRQNRDIKRADLRIEKVRGKPTSPGSPEARVALASPPGRAQSRLCGPQAAARPSRSCTRRRSRGRSCRRSSKRSARPKRPARRQRPDRAPPLTPSAVAKPWRRPCAAADRNTIAVSSPGTIVEQPRHRGEREHVAQQDRHTDVISHDVSIDAHPQDVSVTPLREEGAVCARSLCPCVCMGTPSHPGPASRGGPFAAIPSAAGGVRTHDLQMESP